MVALSLVSPVSPGARSPTTFLQLDVTWATFLGSGALDCEVQPGIRASIFPGKTPLAAEKSLLTLGLLPLEAGPAPLVTSPILSVSRWFLPFLHNSY